MGQVFDVKLHQKSMRTSRIDRCEPRYAGTEFTNREPQQQEPMTAAAMTSRGTLRRKDFLTNNQIFVEMKWNLECG